MILKKASILLSIILLSGCNDGKPASESTSTSDSKPEPSDNFKEYPIIKFSINGDTNYEVKTHKEYAFRELKINQAAQIDSGLTLAAANGDTIEDLNELVTKNYLSALPMNWNLTEELLYSLSGIENFCEKSLIKKEDVVCTSPKEICNSVSDEDFQNVFNLTFNNHNIDGTSANNLTEVLLIAESMPGFQGCLQVNSDLISGHDIIYYLR